MVVVLRKAMRFVSNILVRRAPVIESFDQPNTVAIDRGLFVRQGLGGLVHLLLKLAEDRGTLGPHESHQTGNAFLILDLVYLMRAGGGALIDVIEQTGAKKTRLGIVRPNVEGTGSKFENLLQLNQRRPQVTHTGKRAEETTSLGAGLACHEHPGIVVAGGNLQIGKGLIVHQRGVVGGGGYP